MEVDGVYEIEPGIDQAREKRWWVVLDLHFQKHVKAAFVSYLVYSSSQLDDLR